MASLTRDGFVTELKARGWDRYTDTQLQKYVDWALQEVYRRGQFPAFQADSYSGSIDPTVNSDITFGTIGSAQADRIVSVDRVLFKDTAGKAFNLIPATERFYREVMLPNYATTTVAAGRVVGFPEYYYVYDRAIKLYPIPDQTYNFFAYSKERDTTFASGAATSGLDEPFDAAILAFAEMICNRRARDFEAMAVAESIGMDIIQLEMANSNLVYAEEYPRIASYRE